MATIIAELAKRGTCDVCLVEINPQAAHYNMRVQRLAADWQPGNASLFDLGRQFLQQTQQKSIESVVLLSHEHAFEGPAATDIVHNGSLVPIQVINPLNVLTQVLPATWNSVLLIDLRVPEESILIGRNGCGELERTVASPLCGARFATYLSALSNQIAARAKNGKGARGTSASTRCLQRWLEAAHLFGVTKVLVRSSLADPGSKWRAALAALGSGTKEAAEIVFPSSRDLIMGILKSRQSDDASRPAVVLRESAGAATLTMCSHRDITYAVVHPVRPALDLEEDSLARMVDGRPVLLVVDNNVQRLFGQRIKEYGDQNLKCFGRVIVAGTEQRKTWTQVREICSNAVRIGLPRDGVIVALGGGVTLDLAGTAASLFRRGVPYLRMPTTLVGMVDTAVGIKQGFNFMSKKNVLGSFYPPLGVINDPTFLASLPHTELSCGIAEIIKMAVVRDRNLIELLESNAAVLLQNRFQSPADLTRQVLLRAEQLMMQELQPNLFEACQARLADFGHTFSPSLELASGYALPHGHAVALDMLISTGIAIARGLCKEEVFGRMVRLYKIVGLPLRSSLITMDVLLSGARDACLHRSGKLNLVVPLGFGYAAYLQDLKREDLEYSLATMEQAADETGSSDTPSVSV